MTSSGRPLRFLAVVLGGWTAARVWLLWPAIDSVPALIRAVVPTAAAAPSRAGALPARLPARPAEADRVAAPVAGRPSQATSVAPARPDTPAASPEPVNRPVGTPPQAEAAVAPRYGSPAPVAVPRPAATSRFSASGWLLVRGAGPAGAAPAGQLGGGQGGIRLSYAIDSGRRLALNARLSAPLQGSGREVALGLAWKPTSAPVTLLAEERLPLDGGKPAPALAMVGGINPTPVAGGFRLEGYGQAGAVKRDGAQGFADGYLRIARPLLRGVLALDLGAGLWGGVQPGLARVDVGPSLGVGLPPVAGKRLRLTADWRQRIAGHARPGSGPALSLGLDF